MGSRVSWVLDVDVQNVFDTLDHQQCVYRSAKL